MRNYTADDISAMFKRYEKHISHVIVAHTYHRPYVASTSIGKFKHVDANKYLLNKLAQTSKNCLYALNCFSKLLYPDASNKPVRKPYLYRPLTFVTIEGAKQTMDRAQTIHVNIAIGNLPDVLTADDIYTLFRHAWHEKAKQKDDVKVEGYYEAKQNQGWLGYSLKEVQQQPSRAWNEHSAWDVTNCWIPHDAINAD